MKTIFRQVMAAGALAAVLGATACSTLEASTGYGDDTIAGQPSNDVAQTMASDSLGG